MNTPEIRFAEFRSPWERNRLDDYLAVSGKKNLEGVFGREDVLSVSRDYGVVNQIKFQGRSYAGASVLNYGILPHGGVVYTKSPLSANPFGIIKSNKGSAGIVSTLYAVYSPKENADPDFIDCYFQQDDRLNRYLNPLVNKGAKNDMKVSAENALLGFVCFPSRQEQRTIVGYFERLDSLIALRQQEVDKLKSFKQAMLQKMLPKPGCDAPEIRFKGFRHSWEYRYLGDCFAERLESMPDGELMSVTIGAGVKRFCELGRHDNSSEDKSKYKRVCMGDIAYNSMRMWQGASGWSPFEGIVSPAYTVLIPKDRVHPVFFSYMFKHPDMLRVFQANSQGITSDNWNLKYPVLSQIGVYVPKDVVEQKLIADFFEQLDSLIALRQQEVDKLKSFKQAMLQKMFA